MFDKSEDSYFMKFVVFFIVMFKNFIFINLIIFFYDLIGFLLSKKKKNKY